MENELDNEAGVNETSADQVAEDPGFVQCYDNVWISSDGGTTYVSDPVQGVPYDFCITVINAGEMSSGPFVVKFVLSGDQDPAEEFNTDEISNLEPGESTLVTYHYGSFPNMFAVYHVQAVVCSPDGSTEISTDQGFDFTINTE